MIFVIKIQIPVTLTRLKSGELRMSTDCVDYQIGYVDCAKFHPQEQAWAIANEHDDLMLFLSMLTWDFLGESKRWIYLVPSIFRPVLECWWCSGCTYVPHICSPSDDVAGYVFPCMSPIPSDLLYFRSTAGVVQGYIATDTVNLPCW